MNDTQIMHAMGIDDAYRVEQVLARSARGVTELVTIDGTGPFVRKKIPTSLVRREVWSALNSSTCMRLPHVEATYELPDCFSVILDYVPGPTLAQYVAKQGNLQQGETVILVKQICEAVQELHGLGILHRDLTPSNIVITDDGAHIIDLGIARIIDESDVPRDRDTTALGTYGFAPPEQYGFAPTDVRSDIYSIGRVLGFMLTGVYPDDNRYGQMLADERVVPPRMRAVIERACAFEPSARYQNVADLGAALESPSDPPDSDPVTASRGTPTAGGSRKRIAVAAGIVAAIVIAAIVAGVILFPRMFDGDDDAAVPNASDVPATHEDRPQSGQSESTNANPLELVETGWSADESGYIHYAFGLRNTSDSLCVRFPSVEITGRDDDGSVLFSDTQVLMVSFPGGTTYFGSQAGNGNGTVPATVDFTVLEPEDYTYEHSSESASFEAVNLNVASDGYGGEIFAGEISAVNDSERVREQSSQLAVSLVLRDDAGAIIYGSGTFVDWPAEGGSRPFSMDVLDLPAYDSFEVYAQPW